jgi:hypothetical protein
MAAQIFVPFNKREHIEDMIPYLEALARPGTEIIFLTPYRVAVSWMEVQLTAIQTGLKITAPIGAVLNKDSSPNVRICEEKVRQAQNLFNKRGWKISHQCYVGRLRDAVASLRNPEDEMILLMEERPTTMRSLLRPFAKFIGRLNTDDAAPIVFLRPGRQY